MVPHHHTVIMSEVGACDMGLKFDFRTITVDTKMEFVRDYGASVVTLGLRQHVVPHGLPFR